LAMLFCALLSSLLSSCMTCESREEVTAESLQEEKEYEKKQEAPIDTMQTMVMQIQQCSRLYTAEYQIHKIITHKDMTQVKGKIMNHDFTFNVPSTDRKIAIPMDATLKAFVDFGDFSEANVKKSGRKIEIILPDPGVQLTSSKINHTSIKRDVSIFRSNFSDEELTAYEQQGRQAIIKSIPNLGILDMARDNAARILIPILRQLGYAESDITISFRKEYTLSDLPALVKKGEVK